MVRGGHARQDQQTRMLVIETRASFTASFPEPEIFGR